MNADARRWFIQEHQGETRHYDLRLEIGDRWKCWMLPQGPSRDPSQRRVAVEADDHGIQSEDFEGRISGGQPGTGTVLLWDKGRYWSLAEDRPVESGHAEGHLRLWLDGRKLKGGYELVREHEDDWRLVKLADETADPADDPVAKEPFSIKSGRTLEEIEEV